jgi:hypothetical protein
VDGSGWRAVYDLLTQDGYHVAVEQNPTLTLEGDAAADLAYMTISFPPGLIQPGPVTRVRAWTSGHNCGTAAHLPGGETPAPGCPRCRRRAGSWPRRAATSLALPDTPVSDAELVRSALAEINWRPPGSR